MSMFLEATDVSVFYGKLAAVRSVNFQIQQGATVSIIGPNGAGKTTLLKALMGLLPYSGRVLFDGTDISRLEPEDRVELGIALVPETRELFTEMTVEDNLILGAYRLWSDRASMKSGMDDVFALFPRLKERRLQLAGTMSGGERQMLAVGRALMGKPRLLMLDEPSLGLAPIVVREIFKIIAGLKQRGATVLLVEQNARAALETADYGYVIETGEVACEGIASELLVDPRVTESYLGGSVAPKPHQGAAT
jgi:branched-chain amino acid transport system ATP-binding protein